MQCLLFYGLRKFALRENGMKDNGGSLAPATKQTLKIVFVVLFLDLMGFSIIFPLYYTFVAAALSFARKTLFS